MGRYELNKLTSLPMCGFTTQLVEHRTGIAEVTGHGFTFKSFLVFYLEVIIAEMYPECVIASWDALILLLDAENIERRVQLDAEKKLNVYANYKLQEKTRYAIFIN